MIRSKTGIARISGLLFLPTLVCMVSAPVENLFLTVLAYAVLTFGVIMLWRPSEPPLTMLLVTYQWLQISTKLINADLKGIALDDMLIDGSFGAVHPSMGALSEATLLSLLGLVALILGMALGQRHEVAARPVRDQAHTGTGKVLTNRLVLATFGFIAFSLLLNALRPLVPGSLHQLMLPLIGLKWALIFALFCAVLRNRRGYFWLVLVCGGEILIGLTSYFSAWKEVILIFALSYFYCRPHFDLRRIMAGGVIILLGFFLAVFWTAIKTEQRNFLSLESGQQVIRRGKVESLANVIDLGTATDQSEYSDAIEHLANRIAYVDYFSNVLIHVPAIKDHEYGKLWGSAIIHIFTPRILFPNKPRLQSDSELTMQYTGLLLASDYEGTSISLGYMAESYIDFGREGMLVPIFLWGVFLGFGIRLLTNRFGRSDVVWGTAIVVTMNSLIFEVSTIKMVGGTLMSLMVIYLFMLYVWPWLERNLQDGGQAR